MKTSHRNIFLIILPLVVFLILAASFYFYINRNQSTSQINTSPLQIKESIQSFNSLLLVQKKNSGEYDLVEYKSEKQVLKNLFALSSNSYDTRVEISPDKKQVAWLDVNPQPCASAGQCGATLFISDIQGNNKIKLAENVWLFSAHPFRWTPDGKKIIFMREHSSNDNKRVHNFYLIDIETKKATETGSKESVIPDGIIGVSLGGNKIYFTDNINLYEHNLTSGDVKTIYTDSRNWDLEATISPDYKKILLFADEGWWGGKTTPDHYEIGIFNLSDKSYKKIIQSDTEKMYVSKPIFFLNNSLEIIFSSLQNKKLSVSAINWNTSQQKDLTNVEIKNPTTISLRVISISDDDKILIYSTYDEKIKYSYFEMNLANNISKKISFPYITDIMGFAGLGDAAGIVGWITDNSE